MEADEVHEFANQMKEAGEGGESVRHISLGISILAVLVALVTVLGHRSHTEAMLMQTRAADQWNEYQAKKIRMDNLSVHVGLLALQPNNDASAVAAKTKEYQAHIEKWKVDLAQEQEKALEFEREVAHAEAQAARYDLGEALLQIAVVLCSITLFTRNRAYFLLGLALGATGLVVAFSALLVSRQPAPDKPDAETTRLLLYRVSPEESLSELCAMEVHT
jgi:Domain of unknown function (DUF4337)